MLDGSTSLASDRLLALVEQILARGPADRSLSVHDPLTAAGFCSVDMVNLMLAVEAEFDIAIPAAEITPENFRSIATVEALIVKLASR